MAVGAVAGLSAGRGGPDPRGAASRVAGRADDADCRRCGACCAAFRVSFHWLELEARGLSDAWVEPVGPHRVAMRGTHAKAPRCAALEGTVGEAVRCVQYAHRPSPCREVEPGDERCATARARHGLAPLREAGYVAPPTGVQSSTSTPSGSAT